MPLIKRVRFEAESTIHILKDHIRKSEAEAVWYTKAYLDWAKSEDINTFLHTRDFLDMCPRFQDDAEDHFESTTVTARGLEKVLGNRVEGRRERMNKHTSSVVRKWNKTKNAETVRSYSKSSSKSDRLKALKLGEEDEAEVMGNQRRGSTSSTSKISSSAFGKSFQGKSRLLFPRSSRNLIAEEWLIQ